MHFSILNIYHAALFFGSMDTRMLEWWVSKALNSKPVLPSLINFVFIFGLKCIKRVEEETQDLAPIMPEFNSCWLKQSSPKAPANVSLLKIACELWSLNSRGGLKPKVLSFIYNNGYATTYSWVCIVVNNSATWRQVRQTI